VDYIVWVIVVNFPQSVRPANNKIVLHRIIIAMGRFLGSVSALRSMNGTLTRQKPIKIGATIKDGTQRFSK
ncbi:uncharacterized protein METZ01_LOCUS299046, partial [marine metagenome]